MAERGPEGPAPETVKGALEALLLVASEPLTPRRAAGILGLTEAQARAYLRLLAAEYEERRGGLEVIEVGGGYRLVSRPEFDVYISRLEPTRAPAPLSAAAVETLAIVAYRQPVTRAGIEAVRGVRCEGVLGTLLERGLIEEVGRGEGPGRPILYGTTSRFLEYFGLRDLADLPPLPHPG
ncbi:MAG: SMC-Scp complex subunit ScpB [Bacillota bacterium]